MRLDAAVESALNVLPSNTDAATSFSLYGLLNKAQTSMGKALLKAGPALQRGTGRQPRAFRLPCCSLMGCSRCNNNGSHTMFVPVVAGTILGRQRARGGHCRPAP